MFALSSRVQRQLVPAVLAAGTALATNPLVTDQFTADPSARVFEGRVYVYPSHDILAEEGKGRPGWFCMEDYHVFSSENLSDWTDHGVILRQTEVAWVRPDGYAFWAPDCVERDGRYYFYFPATAVEGGFRIGVAVADSPVGPFTPDPSPLEGVHGIDPCVLIDDDGTAYLYYSLRDLFVVRLRDNLRAIEGEPQTIANLPTEGLKEGPFVFARNGLYYLTYPHVEHETERLEYAIGRHPLGPFEPAGVIMDELPSGCWTNHQSIVAYEGQWYLFYHDNQLSPDFDKARSMRADRLFFNDDGTIRKVRPTLRGVGLVNATDRIQIDHYSGRSSDAIAVSFLDPGQPFAGWRVDLNGPHDWVRFDAVDFASGGQRSLLARVVAPAGTRLEIRLDAPDGPLLARLETTGEITWSTKRTLVDSAPTGVHDLFVLQTSEGSAGLDWLQFE